MHFKKILFSLLSAPYLLQMAAADDVLTHFFTREPPEQISPWFTGPLLAPSVHTIPMGHVNIEPYLFFWTFTGDYNNHWRSQSADHNFYSLQLELPIWVGITPWLDFTVTPQVFYQFTQDEQSTEFADLPFGIDIQLLNESNTGWQPAIKLAFKAVVPTGKYRNLNPRKLGTDAAGGGNWVPTAVLSFGRILPVGDKNFVSPRLAFSYAVPTPLHVHNSNVYGGTSGTKGTVYPGNIFSFDFGLEYNLTQNWVLANDFYYQHNNKNRFSGNTGFLEPGVPAVMTRPSSDQFSLAPAIEYNWSNNVGMIGGVWFTFAGRNAARFVTGTIAINIYI